MQGSIAIRNEVRAMAEQPALEFICTLLLNNTAQAVTADQTLYFQTAYVYPAKGVNADGTIIANAAAISVGKSGLNTAKVLDSLVNFGSIARATKAGHGFRPGWFLNHTGATPAGYNGLKAIFNVTANTYDFQLDADPGGPASVLATAQRVAFLPDVLQPTDLPVRYQLPLGLKMRLADLIVYGTATDGVLIQAW